MPHRCLHIGRIYPVPDWRLDEHMHPNHCEMIVVLSGRIETLIAGQRIVGKPGDVLHYPLGEPHAERSIDAHPLETIFIGWRPSSRRAIADWPLLRHDWRGRMRMIASWMFESRPGRARKSDAFNSQLLQLLLHAYLHGQESAGDDAMIDRVKRHIHEHLATERLDLDELAGIACMSRFHFARRFRSLVGMSPIRFVREARLEAARMLLLTTDLPHRTIARRVGLVDQSQLSRLFRRSTGQAPSELRRTIH